MRIAETRTWRIGPYTVIQRPRLDSPYWPVYVVLRRGKIVGKSFSVPDRGCCQWLDAHRDGRYGAPAAERKLNSYGYATSRLAAYGAFSLRARRLRSAAKARAISAGRRRNA